MPQLGPACLPLWWVLEMLSGGCEFTASWLAVLLLFLWVPPNYVSLAHANLWFLWAQKRNNEL